MLFTKLYIETKKAGKSDEPKEPTAEDFKDARKVRTYYATFEIETLEEIGENVMRVVGKDAAPFYAEITEYYKGYFEDTRPFGVIPVKSNPGLVQTPVIDENIKITPGFGQLTPNNSAFVQNPDGSITGTKQPGQSAVPYKVNQDGSVSGL